MPGPGQARRIALDPHGVFGEVGGEGDLGRLDVAAGIGGDLAHQSDEIDRFGVQVNLTAQNPRDIQEVIDDPPHVAGLPQDNRQHLLGVVVAGQREAEDLGGIADGGERIT